MLKVYEKYLEIIDEYLAKFFEEASPFIRCKKGCTHCCQEGDYPFSHLEFMYLIKGFINLDPKVAMKVKQNINGLKNNSKNLYKCPFLINNECSVYKYRGLICRTHGLTFYKENSDKIEVPNCVNLGLNYSNIYDTEKGIFSTEKAKENDLKETPVIYNISLKELRENELAKSLELDFGDTRTLKKWLNYNNMN